MNTYALNNKILNPKKQFIACSGRLNFELVQKGLMANIGFMTGVGAPTSLAIDLAKRFDMTLLGFSDQGVGVGEDMGQVMGFLKSNYAGQMDFYDGGSLKIRLSSHANANNYISNGGNVGIGTNNPSNNLHIHTDSGDEGILIKSTGDTSNAIISRWEVRRRKLRARNQTVDADTRNISFDGTISIKRNSPKIL